MEEKILVRALMEALLSRSGRRRKGKASHAQVFIIHHPFPHENQECHIHPHTPSWKRILCRKPCTTSKAEATGPPPFLPISSAQESDCSPSALTRFHWRLLPVSFSPSNSSDAQALSDSGHPALAAIPWLPTRSSLQVLRPLALWFQQPLWALDSLF